MGELMERIFVVIYSFVTKRDKEESVINVSIYIGWCVTLSILSLNFFFNIVKLKREWPTYLGVVALLLTPSLGSLKYYFLNNKFEELIDNYNQLSSTIKMRNKVISILFFVFVNVLCTISAQYAFLHK